MSRILTFGALEEGDVMSSVPDSQFRITNKSMNDRENCDSLLSMSKLTWESCFIQIDTIPHAYIMRFEHETMRGSNYSKRLIATSQILVVIICC